MGPLCFLILINDALTDTSHSWKYVDDSTVGIPVNTRAPDYSPLQATLDRLQAWTEEDMIAINDTKTMVMHFYTSSLPPHLLQVVKSIKLLDITVDNQLNWKQHITTIRSASYRIYMLRRLKSLGTPAKELKGVYTSFILPKLMYASPAWSSSLNLTQQQSLERVKKRAWKVILGPAYEDYDKPLTTLLLHRLTTRRLEALTKFRHDLINHHRHRHLLPERAPPPARVTRHHNKLFLLRAPRTDRYRHSAIPTIVRIDNSM